jgi:outer membrane protein assembly factor BamA
VFKTFTFFLTLIVLLLFNTRSFAQDEPSDTTKQDSSGMMNKLNNFNSFMEKFIVYFPVPIFSVSQETGQLFGLTKFNDFKIGVTTKNDTLTQPSTVSGLVYFTQKRQFKVNIESDIMFKDNMHNASSRITFFSFPLLLFGVGNDTKKENAVTVLYENIEFEGGYKYKLRKKLYLGFNYKYLNSLKVEYSDSTENIPDFDIEQFKGLRSGIGFSATWEGRDNRLNAFKGFYINLNYDFFESWLGSDFEYDYLLVDLRKYYTLIGPNKLILAGQFVGEFANSGTPVQALSALGGPKGMRGFYFGRYRDLTNMSGTVEVRFPIFWIIGGVGFVSAGQVARSLKYYSFDRMHYSYGGGIRLMVSSKNRVNLRLDVGFSKDNSTFTLGFTETF